MQSINLKVIYTLTHQEGKINHRFHLHLHEDFVTVHIPMHLFQNYFKDIARMCS